MNIGQLLHICFRSILRNRMRSLLTSLGVIIGVGSVIIMVAMGEGSQRLIENQMSAMGTNLLQISHRPPSPSSRGVYTRRTAFTISDLDKIKNESSYVAAISGVVQNNNANVIGGEGSAQVRLQGVEPDFLYVRNWRVDLGIFFEEEDVTTRNTVAVLGRTTAAALFGNADDALDQQIRIGTIYFTVIGLLEIKGADMDGRDQDDIVIVPLDTAMTRLTNSPFFTQIFLTVVDKDFMEAAQNEVSLILREARNIPDGINADFSIMNQVDMIGMATETSKTLTNLLALIAGVSLLVGGIGIMNIMLVSVTERTREVGIRMAVGGRKMDILMQFLTESIILSLMGGILGIGMAFLACRIMAMSGIPTIINPLIILISTLFAAIVGVIFGYYPALKAARLYPIEALRYE